MSNHEAQWEPLLIAPPPIDQAPTPSHDCQLRPLASLPSPTLAALSIEQARERLIEAMVILVDQTPHYPEAEQKRLIIETCRTILAATATLRKQAQRLTALPQPATGS